MQLGKLHQSEDGRKTKEPLGFYWYWTKNKGKPGLYTAGRSQKTHCRGGYY